MILYERLKPWILAARPKTLTAALVPILVGTALAKSYQDHVIWIMSVYALLGAFFIQIATNLFNDAIDFKKGADTEKRVGPTRVTQSGMASYRSVMIGALFFSLLAFLCGIPLVLHGGWPIVIIGLVSLALAFLYTGGPFPLAYVGLGDLFVILFFGVISVGGVFYLQTLSYSLEAFIAGVQVGSLATVLIVINNMRDREQDELVNKKTMAVRLGLRGSRAEVFLLFALSFALQSLWLSKTWLWAAVLPILSLPIAIWLCRDLFKTPPSQIYNRYLARAALAHLVFGILLALGLWNI